MAEYLIQGESLTAIADEIRELSGTTSVMSLDNMASSLSGANTAVIAEADLIAQIDRALIGKAVGDLPELTNPASADEIVANYQAINNRGEVITGIITPRTESDLSVAGTIVTVPAGYYAVNVNKTIEVNGEEFENIGSLIALELADAQRWFDFYWYDSILTAVAEINGNTIGTSALSDNSSAEVGVYICNDVPHIILLKNILIDTKISITVDSVINLNGYVLTSNDTIAVEISANVTIDAKAEGSKINISSTDGTDTTLVYVLSGTCAISGGNYVTSSSGAGTSSAPNNAIELAANTNLNIDNAIIQMTDTNGGTSVGIFGGSGSTISAFNTQIDITSETGLKSCGVWSTGTINLDTCSIIAKSSYLGNAAGTNFGSVTIGVNSSTVLNMNDCYVYGTHSGIQAKGTVNIRGGKYESYGHGGFYLYNSGTIAHICDAEFKYCDLMDGYVCDGVAKSNFAGGYIGGANNITVYADNCNFYAPVQPIVIKKADYLYISRSRMNLNYSRNGIRIDNSSAKVYIGYNCNFEATDTNRTAVVTATTEIYRSEE